MTSHISILKTIIPIVFKYDSRSIDRGIKERRIPRLMQGPAGAAAAAVGTAGPLIGGAGSLPPTLTGIKTDVVRTL